MDSKKQQSLQALLLLLSTKASCSNRRKIPSDCCARQRDSSGLARAVCITVAPSPSCIIEKRKPQKNLISDNLSAKTNRAFKSETNHLLPQLAAFQGTSHSCLLHQPSEGTSFSTTTDNSLLWGFRNSRCPLKLVDMS